MKADIIACYPKGIMGKLISFVTRSEISHVAIMIDDFLVIEAGWLGVRINKLSELRCKFKALRHNTLTEKQKECIISFVKSSIDMSYDYKLFIGLGLKKLFNINVKQFNDVNKYICTELIVEAYRYVGIHLVDDYNIKLYPQDILESKELKILEEGGK